MYEYSNEDPYLEEVAAHEQEQQEAIYLREELEREIGPVDDEVFATAVARYVHNVNINNIIYTKEETLDIISTYITRLMSRRSA